MPIIAVSEFFPIKGHGPEHHYDFLGLILKADDNQIALIRATHPDIPAKDPAVYEVTLENLLKALANAKKLQAMIYWEQVARPYFIEIPRNCATEIN